jgi:hypothetical protein
VLEAEQGDQSESTITASTERPGRAAAIDRDRHPRQIADEGDQIKEGREEQSVSGEREQKIEDPSHESLPGIGSILPR